MYKKNELHTDEFGRHSGVLELIKPYGVSSQDLVNFCRRVFSTRKIGHTGTLDPLAQGVMLLLVGKSTSLSQILMNKSKSYSFTIVFNCTSPTLDLEDFKPVTDQFILTCATISEAVVKFPKKYLQSLPAFSAAKINGTKIYSLARNSEKFEIDKSQTGYEKLIVTKNNSIKNFNLPQREAIISHIEINHCKEEVMKNILVHYSFRDDIFSPEVIDQLSDEQMQRYVNEINYLRKKSEENLSKLFNKITVSYLDNTFMTLKMKMTVNSGFYIRKFCEDLAVSINPKLKAVAALITREEIFI
jgi:tRNA pseudouridine(55) synthase